MPELKFDAASPELADRATLGPTAIEEDQRTLAAAPNEDDGASTDDDAWGLDPESQPQTPMTPMSRSPRVSPPPEVQVVAPPEESYTPEPVEPEPEPEAPPVEPERVVPTIETETTEYGFDDSQVFGDGGMSASTSGSTYGEWTGESEAGQGYDYVQGYEGQQASEASISIDESVLLSKLRSLY